MFLYVEIVLLVQAQKLKDKIDEIKGFLTNETRSEELMNSEV